MERLGTSGPALGAVLVSTFGVYLFVIALTRLAGPRSLAKMGSFAFAATVAVGSTLASTAVGSVSLSQGAAGLLVLFGLQAAVASAANPPEDRTPDLAGRALRGDLAARPVHQDLDPGIGWVDVLDLAVLAGVGSTVSLLTVDDRQLLAPHRTAPRRTSWRSSRVSAALGRSGRSRG